MKKKSHKGLVIGLLAPLLTLLLAAGFADIQRKALAEYQRTAEARLRALFGIGIHTTFKRLPGFANKLHPDGKAVHSEEKSGSQQQR